MFRFLDKPHLWISILVWAIINVVHTFLLTWHYHLPFSYSLSDSIIFNTLYSVLALGIWLMTIYSDIRKKSPVELLFNHITSCTISILIWIGLSKMILSHLFSEHSELIDFLNNSIMIRVIGGILVYLLLSSIFYLMISSREIQQKMMKEAELNNLLKDAELKMLRSQIRPHFLFNSLNSISSLTISSPEKAQEMIIKLSDLMRFSLGYTDETTITFEKELNYLRLYLDIEKIRFGNRLLVREEIPSTCLRLLLPAMILQPVIENAVKYGIYETSENNCITISASCSANILLIKIENEFEPQAIINKGTGTGLRNIAERLATLYGNAGLLKIDKKDKIFSVSIEIPQYG